MAKFEIWSHCSYIEVIFACCTRAFCFRQCDSKPMIYHLSCRYFVTFFYQSYRHRFVQYDPTKKRSS